ncbi:hypothetical protein G7059_07155 [Erysipelothrix sp. HDW6A]|uniref:hypothetical protein n=1 Tax=Erysipelothrix sp. HDW6A TaxID=2714928 RepID=UPI00140C7E20|nr:hypothetical protein [Erysipelothrix sp. HDW6A]QIK57636.1 hypothetical protein G7059_07155 [Erysipelothrix sp. HDW6A]
MKSSKGFILPSTLVLLLFFVSWFTNVCLSVQKHLLMDHYLNVVRLRIQAETQLFSKIRDSDEIEFYHYYEGIRLNAVVYDTILIIKASGIMEYYREYDIITDGSFVIR